LVLRRRFRPLLCLASPTDQKVGRTVGDDVGCVVGTKIGTKPAIPRRDGDGIDSGTQIGVLVGSGLFGLSAFIVVGEGCEG
jgi:hypothetical protein